jgi:large subunit ribosomal protein L9
MIEVILLERIERLGQMGQVVKVRPGFARNFLLPQKKALRATKANLEVFEKQRSELEAKNAAERGKAEALAARMADIKLVIVRQASETAQLYGSVSARDVADAALEAGHKIERTQVQIDKPIKALGLFPVKIRLHPEVTVTVTANVARSAEEAVVQAEKGAAVILAEAEKAEVVAAFGAPAEESAEATPKKKSARKAKAEDAEAGDADEGEEKKEAKPAKKAKAAKDADEEEPAPKAKKAKAK